MIQLLLLSLPFAALGYVVPRFRVVLVPYAAWGGFAVLEAIGVLPGGSSAGAILLAGTLGAVFAAGGVQVRRARRLRPA